MERRTREHWLTLIKEHEASGQTLTEFCRGRGLGMPALRWWRWKLGSGKKKPRHHSRAVRILPIDVVESAETADRDGEVILEFANVTLKFPTGTSPDYLASLIAAIRARC